MTVRALRSRRFAGLVRFVSALGLISGVLSCGSSMPTSRAPSDVVAKNVTSDPGVVLAMACTPTGPELCFNAVDDNCNGVVDEGCGSGTGVLQFTIAWGDSPADVDLQVTDPAGDKIEKKHETTPSGLRREKDCPDDGCHGQNVENVYFQGNTPPRGTYRVEVKLLDPRDSTLPVHVHLTARIGSRTFAMDVELTPAQAREGWGFSFVI